MRSPIAKFLSEQELARFRGDPSTTVLFVADEPKKVARVLGALRVHLGNQLGLIDEQLWRPVWIVDFPMFDWDEETQTWTANHHPFTSPTPEDRGAARHRPGRCVAQSYDLVVNGTELGSGSIRIHGPELQAKVFDILRISPEEQRERFGFLLDALAMGAPPHGGFAPGMDRTDDVARARAEPPRRDRVPEEPGGPRSDDRERRARSRRNSWLSSE